MMKAMTKALRSSTLVQVFVALLCILTFCEWLIYYLVLWQCHYPQLKDKDSDVLNAMILADTHLLGSRNGHWFDKLRREWQMSRAFITAQALFRPDLVIFLGDVFDEGKWCKDQEFDYYVRRFKDLFPVGGEVEVKVVAGNHDMGFHYAVTPHLEKRFELAFDGASPAEMFVVKGISFVGVNSMAMEGDGCFLCREGKDALEQVATELSCLLKEKQDCELDYDFKGAEQFPRPILLQHFPLFRESDAECAKDGDAAPFDERNKQFKPNWDCVSAESSKFLLDKTRPRLVLSGHTHHGCRLDHQIGQNESVSEWSVSSFSWRNRNNPTFLLARFTAKDLAIEKCFMPEENTVIDIYTVTVLVVLLWIANKKLRWSRRRVRF